MHVGRLGNGGYQFASYMMKSLFSKSLRRACSVGALTVLGVLGGASLGRADVFTVTNTNDSGPGSLRAAITQANSSPYPDADIIEFATTGVIRLESSLPSLAEDLVIIGPGATNPTFYTG